jgi:very-short-patch-repair endonuclease
MNANKEQARHLRRNATPAEIALWERLRARRLHGLKFHRQYPIGPFVADFCCKERRIVVELDGEVHEGEQSIASDKDRDRYLRGQGYLVLRIPNQQVFSDLDSVLKQISNITHTRSVTLGPCQNQRPEITRTTPPLPERGEGWGRERGPGGEGSGGGRLPYRRKNASSSRLIRRSTFFSGTSGRLFTRTGAKLRTPLMPASARAS